MKAIGKMLPTKEQSLDKPRKELPTEEVPLIVPKVVKQYTRMKIEEPEQTMVKEEVYIKEEHNIEVEIHIKEEVNIKEEIESDSDVDGKLLLTEKDEVSSKTFDIKNEGVDSNVNPSNGLLDGLPEAGPETSLTKGDGIKGGKNLIKLKKCYLVAVNVEPEPLKSSCRRQTSRRRRVALLEAKEVGTPENLPPFKLVAKSEIFTCEFCDKTFLSHKEVRAHLLAAHKSANDYQCQDCPASFSHHYLLLAHLRRHTGKPLACDLCSKRFKKELTYSNHLNTHLRERLFSCPVCLRRYTDLDSVQRHVLQHSPEDNFDCETCDEKNRSLLNLRRHREKVHGEKSPYPCYMCTRVLDSEHDFYNHLNSHENAVYECAFCTKRFTDATRWEDHSIVHIEKKKTVDTSVVNVHDCEICHKRFKYASTLKTHMKSHTGERPYSCGVCSKTFKTRSAVTEHENSHKRPFACPECDARFGRRETLDRHYRTHSGERPYACSTCGLAFTQRSSMLIHARIHHTSGSEAKRKKANKKSKSKSNKN